MTIGAIERMKKLAHEVTIALVGKYVKLLMRTSQCTNRSTMPDRTMPW